MNVGFDQAGAGEPAACVINSRRLAEPMPDRGDSVGRDADLGRFPHSIGESGIPNDQVHPARIL